MASVAGLYLIVVASLCLSVFNHFRYEELKNGKIYGESYVEGGGNSDAATHSRSKRDTSAQRSAIKRTPVLSEEDNALFKSLGELRQFIQEEFNQSIQQYFNNIVALKKLKKKLRALPRGSPKCACQGERGLQGPPGERGKPGLGLYPPRLKSKVLDVTANASDSKVLSCKFFGNPIPTTRWQTNVHNTKVTIETDRENSEVTTRIQIKNITWEDRGNVTCSASTILGEDEASGLLTVHAAPIISLDTQLFFATVGTTASFPECKVHSSPPAEITWKRGFLPFSKGRTQINGGVLEIAAVRVQDEGYYECVARNYLGTSSKLIQLRTRPFQFSKKPSFFTYTSNASVTLSCAAYGPPERIVGKWMDMVSGEGLPFTSRKSDDGVEISAVVWKPGKYKCIMSDNVTMIEGYTEVTMFTLLNSSSILNGEQVHTLGSWLRNGDFIGAYRLCWSARGHGFGVKQFQNRCSGKSNTISIFQTNNGTVFGGFTDIPWKSSASYYRPYNRYTQYQYGSSKSFLFMFKEKATKITIRSLTSKGTCYNRLYGPCFGAMELYYHKTPRYYNRYSVRASIGVSYWSNEVTSLAKKVESSVDNAEVYYKI